MDENRKVKTINVSTNEIKLFESIKRAAVYYFGGTRSGYSAIRNMCNNTRKTSQTKHGKIKACYVD
jgi:hypothetical protein